MKDNLKDILSHLHSEVDQETLLKYLEGKLSAEEQHDLEKSTLDDDFESEALEGLAQFENKAKLSGVIESLNRDLKKKTEKNRKWPHRRKVKLEPWLLISIVIVLLIAIISYFIIHKLRHP